MSYGAYPPGCTQRDHDEAFDQPLHICDCCECETDEVFADGDWGHICSECLEQNQTEEEEEEVEA